MLEFNGINKNMHLFKNNRILLTESEVESFTKTPTNNLNQHYHQHQNGLYLRHCNFFYFLIHIFGFKSNYALLFGQHLYP